MAFAAKRESRPRTKNREFSGEKRQLMATNSLLDVLTHIERISKATRPGFEPGQREPKSLVLPLHYRVSRALKKHRVYKRQKVLKNLTHFAGFGQGRPVARVR